jgi:hypothetical protein
MHVPQVQRLEHCVYVAICASETERPTYVEFRSFGIGHCELLLDDVVRNGRGRLPKEHSANILRHAQTRNRMGAESHCMSIQLRVKLTPRLALFGIY